MRSLQTRTIGRFPGIAFPPAGNPSEVGRRNPRDGAPRLVDRRLIVPEASYETYAMSPDRIAFMGAVGAFTLISAAIDVRTGRLPNVLTVPARLPGPVVPPRDWVSQGLEAASRGLGEGLLLSLGGFAVGFGLFFMMWLGGSASGGDVKFMGAIGAWLGPMPTIYVFLLGAVYILLVTILLWIWGRLRIGKELAGGMAGWTNRHGQRVMVWGLPIALAVWSVMFYTEFFGRK